MKTPVTQSELLEAVKRVVDRKKRLGKASRARSNLRPFEGSSRARSTTANANHASAAEIYAREREHLVNLCKRVAEDGIEF